MGAKKKKKQNLINKSNANSKRESATLQQCENEWSRSRRRRSISVSKLSQRVRLWQPNGRRSCSRSLAQSSSNLYCHSQRLVSLSLNNLHHYRSNILIINLLKRSFLFFESVICFNFFYFQAYHQGIRIIVCLKLLGFIV